MPETLSGGPDGPSAAEQDAGVGVAQGVHAVLPGRGGTGPRAPSLDTPAAPALVENLDVVQALVPFDSEGLGLGLGLGLGHRETDRHGTLAPSGDDRTRGEPGARGATREPPGEAPER